MLNSIFKRREDEERVRKEGRLPPGQSLTERFPVLHYGPIPSFDPASWDFKVSGEVENPLTLTVTEESLSICRLAKEDAPPRWAWTGPFVSVTRTEQELSVVCAASAVPEGVQTEPGWRAPPPWACSGRRW